jgi:hypothetical protein
MKTIFTFLGIWFVASILNGILSGLCIEVVDNGTIGNAADGIILSTIFSFVFSAPLVGVVWLITAVTQSTGKDGHIVLQVALKSALLCSTLGAVFFIYTLGSEFKEAKYFVGLCIIFSAFTAVLLFRKQLKNNE